MAKKICTTGAMAALARVDESVIRRWIKAGLLVTEPCRCRPRQKPHHRCTVTALEIAMADAWFRARAARLRSLSRNRVFGDGQAIAYEPPAPDGRPWRIHG